MDEVAELDAPRKRKRAKEPAKPYDNESEVARACATFVTLTAHQKNHNKAVAKHKKLKTRINARLLVTFANSAHNVFNFNIGQNPFAVLLHEGEGKRKWEEDDLVAHWMQKTGIQEKEARILYKLEHEADKQTTYSLKIVPHHIITSNIAEH